jgi:hypothetical protein
MNSRRLMLTMAEMLQQHLQQTEKHLAASDQLIRDQRGALRPLRPVRFTGRMLMKRMPTRSRNADADPFASEPRPERPLSREERHARGDIEAGRAKVKGVSHSNRELLGDNVVTAPAHELYGWLCGGAR